MFYANEQLFYDWFIFRLCSILTNHVLCKRTLVFLQRNTWFLDHVLCKMSTSCSLQTNTCNGNFITGYGTPDFQKLRNIDDLPTLVLTTVATSTSGRFTIKLFNYSTQSESHNLKFNGTVNTTGQAGTNFSFLSRQHSYPSFCQA